MEKARVCCASTQTLVSTRPTRLTVCAVAQSIVAVCRSCVGKTQVVAWFYYLGCWALITAAVQYI